jgi:release factor glutamine methyltransferase
LAELALARATVAASLARGRERLAAAGCESPRLDAELLLAHALGHDSRARLVLDADKALEADQLRSYEQLLTRREEREPVAYILGHKWFRRICLQVDPRVLVPRPETELLVEAGLSLPVGARVADIGTGSGAVALALAHERADLRVTGIDISEDALAVALANRERLGLDVRFVRADLLGDGAYDAVLANLPYVPRSAALAPEIEMYEPLGALYAGADGLSAIRRLAGRLRAREDVRFAALELGPGQAGAVAELLRGAGFSGVEAHRDLAGFERVVVGRR